MGKRSGPLQYVQLLVGDPDLTILEEISPLLKQYVVIATDLVAKARFIYGMYTDFQRAYRACKSQAHKGPRCFLQSAFEWFAVNPDKMPH
jgi:hypothetical protein